MYAVNFNSVSAEKKLTSYTLTIHDKFKPGATVKTPILGEMLYAI